jgi:hypothetical protein
MRFLKFSRRFDGRIIPFPVWRSRERTVFRERLLNLRNPLGRGRFLPRSRRVDLLDDFRRCDALTAFEEEVFFSVAVCACEELANTPSPAASSSVGAR